MKLLLIPFLIFGSAQAATSLKEAFESAKKNMETLRRAEATLQQKIERKDQAVGVAMPNISGVGTYTKIDPPDTAGVNSAFLLTRQYSGAIRMVQPIIRGGVWSAYQLAKEDILLAQFQKDASMITLYQLVIQAYYNLFSAQVDLEILKESLNANKDRVKEMKSLADVGRSRKGELVQAQSQLLTAEAQYQNGVQLLKQAEETFFFYTGMKANELMPLQNLPKELGTLADYTNKLKARPDILAKEQAVRVAERQIEVSKGGHYPSLDFVGNYYLTRTGILQTSKWDAGLAVTLPIFQGGQVQAQVRESVEKKRVAELDSSEFFRTSHRDLSILYQNHYVIQERLKTLKDALDHAQEAYKLNRKDYKFGQSTNLDVIQSLNLYIETKRTYTALLTVANLTYKNIEASIGVLP